MVDLFDLRMQKRLIDGGFGRVIESMMGILLNVMLMLNELLKNDNVIIQ
jgi:hypothetical protein